MASSSRSTLHSYSFRDQSTANARDRRSMLIGHLMDGGQGFWVSYDRRGDGEHPRYWKEKGEGMSLIALKGRIEYAEGLELSHFSAMKKTKAQKPQKEKRKQLINKIYRQGGVLYQGDYEEIEAAQAAKHASHTGKRDKASGKVTRRTPKKTQQPKQDSGSLLKKLYTDAPSLPATEEFAKRLRAAMLEEEEEEEEEETNEDDDDDEYDEYMENYFEDEEDEEMEENEGDEEDGVERSGGDGREGDLDVETDFWGHTGENNEEGSHDDDWEVGREDRDEKSSSTGEKKDDSQDGGESGPSERNANPIASGVSTQSDQPLQGSSGTGTPTSTQTFNRAYEQLFYLYNYKPWIGSCNIVN